MKLWETFQYPGWPKDEPITDELIIENFRYWRIPLLVKSDWTQLSDSPLTEDQRLAWSNYRQELRDLPNVSDPRSVDDWPTPPTVLP